MGRRRKNRRKKRRRKNRRKKRRRKNRKKKRRSKKRRSKKRRKSKRRRKSKKRRKKSKETGLKMIIPPRQPAEQRGRRRATLLVCPTSLISHWAEQLDRHLDQSVRI